MISKECFALLLTFVFEYFPWLIIGSAVCIILMLYAALKNELEIFLMLLVSWQLNPYGIYPFKLMFNGCK